MDCALSYALWGQGEILFCQNTDGDEESRQINIIISRVEIKMLFLIHIIWVRRRNSLVFDLLPKVDIVGLSQAGRISYNDWDTTRVSPFLPRYFSNNCDWFPFLNGPPHQTKNSFLRALTNIVDISDGCEQMARLKRFN